MAIETKQLHALSKVYLEAVYGGAKKEAPKDTRLVVTAADKKANTKAYQNYKAGNKAYKAADHLKTEDAKYGYDKDGNSLNPKDIKKRKKDVKEGMKQARANVGASTCWDGYKAKGTKKKGGKEVPNCVKEEELSEKKLDPVGKEDKDIDNDGDHDKSDKYLLARRKKVSKIIAMKKK